MALYPPNEQAARDSNIPLRISRGMQRAIGAMMVVTPVGAKRHYTMSYSGAPWGR